MELSKIISTLKQPYVLILIGPPLSGKSFEVDKILKNNPDHNIEVISRDEIVMDLYGSRNYGDAFQKVDQKRVDSILKGKLTDANRNKVNTIIDMTHMGSKRRKYNLSFFDNDYYKFGIIFPILPDEEYIRRNKKRDMEEDKNIEMYIVKRMISQYQPIREEEGFNKVISL